MRMEITGATAENSAFLQKGADTSKTTIKDREIE
jgi:hypothetical protein